MTLDEAIRHAEEVAEYDCYNDDQRKCADEHRQLAEWLRELKRLRESATDTDTISRQAAIDEIRTCRFVVDAIEKLIGLPSAEPKTGRDCTDFVRWLMDEVMDEENWQMNAVANGEIICRKLKKLGMLDVVDGYYIKTQETGDMRGE